MIKLKHKPENICNEKNNHHESCFLHNISSCGHIYKFDICIIFIFCLITLLLKQIMIWLWSKQLLSSWTLTLCLEGFCFFLDGNISNSFFKYCYSTHLTAQRNRQPLILDDLCKFLKAIKVSFQKKFSFSVWSNSSPEAVSTNSINGFSFSVYTSALGSGFNPICPKLGQYVHLLSCQHSQMLHLLRHLKFTSTSSCSSS